MGERMDQLKAEPKELVVNGFNCLHDEAGGHLVVYHDGNINWDDLFAIKNEVWGHSANAIEVYPKAHKVVRSVNARHLWRLGKGDYCPDLLGDDGSCDGLQARQARVWNEARNV